MPSEDLISDMKLGFKEETTTLQNEHFDIQTVEIGPGVGGWTAFERKAMFSNPICFERSPAVSTAWAV